MNCELETKLWEHIQAGKMAREWIKSALASGTLKHPKQAWRTLEKWEAKGLYDCGVALDLGWLKNATMPERKAA